MTARRTQIKSCTKVQNFEDEQSRVCVEAMSIPTGAIHEGGSLAVVKRVEVCGLTLSQGDVRDFFAAENLKVIQIRENYVGVTSRVRLRETPTSI